MNHPDEFPFHCQTKTNTIRNEKGIERSFIINFSINQQNKSNNNNADKKIQSIPNKNEKINIRPTNNINRKDPINIINRKDPPKNVKTQQINLSESTLSSSTLSSAASAYSSKPNIPSLPYNYSKHKSKYSKVSTYRNQVPPFATTSNKNPKNYPILQENSSADYDADYSLISDTSQNISYNDQSQYDYDMYYSETDTPSKKIHFVNGESMLSALSDLSEMRNSSSTIPTPVSQQKFCEIDDLTESFMRDANEEQDSFVSHKSPLRENMNHESSLPNDHSWGKEDENSELVNILLSDITNEINKIQAKSRKPLAISDSIHIFIDNPAIQKLKGNVRFPNVHITISSDSEGQPTELKKSQKYSPRKNNSNKPKEGKAIQQTKEKFVIELVEEKKINANNAIYLNKLINQNSTSNKQKADLSSQQNNSQRVNRNEKIINNQSNNQAIETKTLMNISDQLDLSISKDRSSSGNASASNSIIKEFIKQNNEIINDLKDNEKPLEPKPEEQVELKSKIDSDDTSIISTVLLSFENKKQGKSEKNSSDLPFKSRKKMSSNSGNSSVHTSPEADTRTMQGSTIRNSKKKILMPLDTKTNPS